MVQPARVLPVALLIALGSVFAQRVDLQGVIRDRYTSAPVSGARLTLVGLGLETSTDTSGRFRILQLPTGMMGGNPARPLRSTGGRTVAFRCEHPGRMSLRLTDPAGKDVFSADFHVAESGDWEIDPGSVPPGLYFARLQGPSLLLSAKLLLLAGNSGKQQALALQKKNHRASALSKAAAAVDSLRVSRAGYRPAAFPVPAWEQADLAFSLSDTTVSMGRLVALTTSAGSLVPAFSPAVLAYRIDVPDTVAAIRLLPEAGPAKPTLRVNGVLLSPGSLSAPIALAVGSNRITLQVVSRDSSESTAYVVDVQRASPDTAALAALSLSAGTLTPAFSPGVFTYTATIPFGVSSFTITARPKWPSHILLMGSTVLEHDKPSSPITVIPVPRTITVSVRTGMSAPFQEVAYTLVLSQPPNPNHDPTDATIASLVYDPPRPYLFPFRDTSWQVSRLEWRDSVFDITATLSNPGASLTFNKVPQASGVPWRIQLPYGRTQVLMETQSPDGTRARYYYLIFYRPKPLPTPVVSGPTFVLAGVPATYTATAAASSNCLGSITTRHRFDFGDGTFGYATPASHAWAAPGTYPVKFRTSCHGFLNDSLIAQSDWSEPLLVTAVSDTSSQHPLRRVSGYRPLSETWHPDTTYVITGHTRFDTTATLTILPGTRVQFLSDTTYLNVAKISAVGTPADSIRFEVGEVRVQWNRYGGQTFNADGSYRTGPRFEYCSFPNSRIHVEYNIDTYGGSGFYLKHSSVKLIRAGTWGYAVGSYIEHSRVENLQSLRLYQSRVLNSYFGALRVNTDRAYSLEIRKCDIQTLAISTYEFDQAVIVGNTIRSFQCGSYAGTLSGNNILPSGATAASIGTVNIDMRGNYWGPAVTAEMEAKGSNQDITVIRDIFDDVNLGKVDYSGWRTEPVPGAQPDW